MWNYLNNNLELVTCSQEQAGEYLQTYCSDIDPSSLLRSMSIPEKSCCNGSETESCHDSRSGTMLPHSTVDRGADSSIASQADFLARTSAQPEKAQDSTGNEADFGPRWPGSLARYNLGSRSWKTRQCLLLGGLESFSETWPQWGMMRDGECWEVAMQEGTVCANVFGLLPAPQASDGPKWYVVKPESAKRRYTDGRQEMLIHAIAESKEFPDWSRYVANPQFWEVLMGWPAKWTDCEPLATGKIQDWRHSHGEF